MCNYCRRCDRYFSSSQALKQHRSESSAHVKKTYPCPVCVDTFLHAKSLQRHLSEEHYECACCDKFFYSKEDRYKHERKAHLYCSKHDKSFQNSSNLRAHLNSVYHLGRTVKCVCTAGFPTLSAVFLHIEEQGCDDMTPHLEHHLARMMSIKYRHHLSAGRGPLFEDPAGTLDKWTTKYALDCKKDDDDDDFYCFGCGQRFERQTEFVCHLYDRDEFEGRSIGCLHCDAKFSRPSGALQHKESGSCWGR